jgi:hypothetical protein
MMRFLTVTVLVVTAACVHKPARPGLPPAAQKQTAKAECSRLVIDSLSPARRDSARIACAGYRYQTLRIF